MVDESFSGSVKTLFNVKGVFQSNRVKDIENAARIHNNFMLGANTLPRRLSVNISKLKQSTFSECIATV